MTGLKGRLNIADILFVLSMTFVLAIPGPSRMKAISIIAFFCYMIVVKLINFREKHNRLHIVWLFSFLILAYLSKRWALYPQAVSEQITNVLWTVLLSIAIAEYVICYKLDAEKIAKRILFISIIFIINILLNAVFTNGRLSIGINENTFGRIASGMTCFLFFYCKKQKWRNIFWDIITAVMAIVVFLSGSRTCLIILAIYIVALIFFEHPSRNILKYVGSALLFLVVCIFCYILIMNIDFLYNSIGNRFESFIGAISGNSTGDGSMITRQNMIEYAKNIFIEHPWIGIGLNNFKYATYFNTYAHSNYYELAACLGVVGLAVYYLPLIIYLIKAMKMWIANIAESIIPFSIFAAFLVGDFGSVTYFNPIPHVFIGLAIGMLCNNMYSYKKEEGYINEFNKIDF